MTRKQWSRLGLRGKVVREMKELGVHRSEYGLVIDVYVDLQMHYLRVVTEFEDGGYIYETETAAGGSKKSALVATMESLRKDILAYSDRLMLNPKAMSAIGNSGGAEKPGTPPPPSPFGIVTRPK